MIQFHVLFRIGVGLKIYTKPHQTPKKHQMVQVINEFTTSKVLALTFVAGTKISDLKTLGSEIMGS